MKRVLFKRVLFTYLIIAPLLFVSLEIYLSRAIKNNYISTLEQNLIKQANLISEQIPRSFSNNLDDFCRKFKNTIGARVTVIDSSGLVLGDSDEPSAKMENHADRPEIKEADISGKGSSIRYSKTVGQNLFYLAIVVHQNSEKRYLRLSMPLHDVETAVNSIRTRILIASLTAVCIAIFIGFIQTRRVTKSVEEITAFAQEVAAGNLSRRLFLKEQNELGALGRNISEIALELNDKLKQTQAEKYKMEAILRNMSDGLILTDTKGLIILSNDAIMHLFGIQSSIEGKSLMETLRNAELKEIVDAVVHNVERVTRGIELNRPRELYLMATASPFFSPGPEKELSGVVLTFHDITRLKKLEEIRKDFVANVSHEIKTPITAIKGFAETLLEGALDDRENARKFLETIKNHSERLNSLVSDLLTLSRIELGDIRITKTSVDLSDVIDSVFTTLGDKADKKGLYLRKELSAGITEVAADRDRLIQILLNLADNGIKFTEQGGIAIQVKREKLKLKNEDERENDYIVISVEDTGVGIPRKHLSRLGERFYRVDRARSRELGGTGLGLAIVKHLVKASGWDMEIKSTEGQGTTVRILCPAV
jgi:two-component system phosphate regulon sensor histidine kinase PhoR